MLELNKIYCGDCLDVMKQIDSNSIDLVVTSPPYNKAGKPGPNWKNSDIGYDNYVDNVPEKEYQEWQKSILRECIRIIKPSGSIFYNHKPRQKDYSVILPTEWLEEFKIRQVIIWDRNSTPNINPINFYPTTEWIIWIRKDKPYFNPDFAKFKEVWTFPADFNNEHPAPFPVELPYRCIESCSSIGEIIFDPFMGSGTTAIAAKTLDRNYIGSEISPEYCKMAEERIKNIPAKLI